tara:strand:- start:293 stop:496 length:204 start_codon:yes stop_codon:yes gene_type:complete
MWEERLKEDLAISIANIISEKTSKERLALIVASIIAEKHGSDEESVRALEYSVKNGNAEYLLNWPLL